MLLRNKKPSVPLTFASVNFSCSTDTGDAPQKNLNKHFYKETVPYHNIGFF